MLAGVPETQDTEVCDPGKKKKQSKFSHSYKSYSVQLFNSAQQQYYCTNILHVRKCKTVCNFTALIRRTDKNIHVFRYL